MNIEVIYPFLLAFLGGGILCVIAQLLIDLTNLTPARILVSFVCTGVFLYAIGAYDFLFSIFGCGVSLPLLGFGGAIGRGVKEAVDSSGAMGILTGGLTATAAGISFALLLAFVFCLIFKAGSKKMSKK